MSFSGNLYASVFSSPNNPIYSINSSNFAAFSGVNHGLGGLVFLGGVGERLYALEDEFLYEISPSTKLNIGGSGTDLSSSDVFATAIGGTKDKLFIGYSTSTTNRGVVKVDLDTRLVTATYNLGYKPLAVTGTEDYVFSYNSSTSKLDKLDQDTLLSVASGGVTQAYFRSLAGTDTELYGYVITGNVFHEISTSTLLTTSTTNTSNVSNYRGFAGIKSSPPPAMIPDDISNANSIDNGSIISAILSNNLITLNSLDNGLISLGPIIESNDLISANTLQISSITQILPDNLAVYNSINNAGIILETSIIPEDLSITNNVHSSVITQILPDNISNNSIIPDANISQPFRMFSEDMHSSNILENNIIVNIIESEYLNTSSHLNSSSLYINTINSINLLNSNSINNNSLTIFIDVDNLNNNNVISTFSVNDYIFKKNKIIFNTRKPRIIVK